MKRLIANFKINEDVLNNFREECKLIFEDIRNNGDRRVPVLYGYWLSPIIYKPKKDNFDLEFTYIDATDNLYGYASITFSYDNVMHYHYNKALEEFLNACEVTYKSIYAESN